MKDKDVNKESMLNMVKRVSLIFIIAFSHKVQKWATFS